MIHQDDMVGRSSQTGLGDIVEDEDRLDLFAQHGIEL